jgi:predicted nucleic acid-binding protein
LSSGNVSESPSEFANYGRMGASYYEYVTDSIMLATAHLYKATLWTQDSDFKGIEGIQDIRKN